MPFYCFSANFLQSFGLGEKTHELFASSNYKIEELSKKIGNFSDLSSPGIRWKFQKFEAAIGFNL